MKTRMSTGIITPYRTKLGLCAVWALMPLFVYAASHFAPQAMVTAASESRDQRSTHNRFSARPLTTNSFTNSLPNVALPQAPAQAKPVDFNRDIKPILEASCYLCHAGEKAKAQLRLDVKAAALAGGISGPAINPGHSKDSLLLQRVLGLGDQPRMPPVGDPLGKEKIETLRAWIDQGAVWPDADGQTTASSAAGPAKHWAYVKPVRSTIPTIKNVSWPRNPIDNFILARLEKENLAPSPEASKEALIRRVTLDLIGLPPGIKEVDDFVADRSTDAYEKVVDRLLASPHYGERWARPWLDLARYADTNGFEKDNRRAMWKYRDWVIDALNKDMPFDQFTVEQIAGDMLPGATAEQMIASGFHRNAMLNEEGGVDPEEARWETNVDRVNATSTVWLGSTLACAQCHNHKYDPFTQKDYYRLFAFFENVDYKLEGDAVISEVKLREPKFETPSSEQEAKRREIDAEIAKLEETLKTQTPELENSQREWEREVGGAGASWTTLDPSALSSSGGSTLTEAADKSVTASGNNPHADTYTVEARASLKEITALRLEVMADPSLPHGGPGRDIYGNFTLSGISIEVATADAPTQFQSLTFVNAVSDDGSSGVKNLVKYESDEYGSKGWSIDATKEETRFNRQAVFVTDKPFGDTREMLFKVKLKHESADGRQGIGRFRLSVSSAKDPTSIANISMRLRPILDIPVEQRTEQQRKDLSGYYLSIAPQLKPTRDRLAQALKSIDALGIPSTLVMRERATFERPSTFLRVRGSFITPGEKVYAGVPAVLHTLPESQLPNRLGLAYWLVSEDNPLVARVTVNRFWEQLFGRGIVETSEDFGAQGDTPTHPELLDWLATEFAGQRWSMKAMHRLIVTSATYRQSSKVTPGLLERDPYNRLLARGPRFRMEGEMIRDVALAASGLLNRKVGGASVFPFQPEGIWSIPYNNDKWQISNGSDRHRRALYTFWRRTSPYPSLTTFDAPSREFCTVRRVRTNTPLQALTTLNDPAFFEMARALAGRIIAEAPPSIRERAAYGFRLSVVRQPTAAEVDQLTAMFERQLARFRTDSTAAAQVIKDVPASTASSTAYSSESPTVSPTVSSMAPPTAKVDAPELAAWTMVANVLLNLDETVTKE